METVPPCSAHGPRHCPGRERCPLLGISRLEGAGGSRHGHEAQNGIPHPRGPGRNDFSRDWRAWRPRVGFRSKPPPPREPQPPEDSPTSHAQDALEELLRFRFFFFFLNNFALGRHDLHSPARRSEPRNNKGVETTQQFGSPQSALCCAPRGFASGRHVPDPRAAPKTSPPSPQPSPPPPSRPGRGRGAAKPLSTLPPPPLAAKPDSTAAGCAPARGAGSGAGAGGGGRRAPGRGLKRPERRGAGEGLGPRPEPTLSSQRVTAPAPARLSHVRAKNPLQSLFLARGRPPGPRAGRQPGPEPCHPLQNPGAATRPGGPSARTLA